RAWLILLSFGLLAWLFAAEPLRIFPLVWSKTLTTNSKVAPSLRLKVQLAIQEAIFSDTRGLSRHQEPVTVGIPLPDSAGIKETSELGLDGATVGQFRALGRWPSGNLEWVLVDTQADVAVSTISRSVSLTTGSGDFGGPRLATDEGSTIAITT